MKPYVLSKLSQEEIELFEKIRRAVNDLPDIDLGKNEDGENLILSCHILARAVAKSFHLQYVDGYFYPCYQHTWLLTLAGNTIDVYPVAVLGGPILMDRLVAKHLYKEKPVLNGETIKLSFRRAVKIITEEFKKIAV